MTPLSTSDKRLTKPESLRHTLQLNSDRNQQKEMEISFARTQSTESSAPPAESTSGHLRGNSNTNVFEQKGNPMRIDCDIDESDSSSSSSDSSYASRERAFIFSLLDLHQNFYIADLKQNSEKASRIPTGLELLSATTRLRVTKREVIPDDDLTYDAFCQYDVLDDSQGMNIAIAIENSDPVTVFCIADARPFDMQIYDYVCERILHIRRRLTCSFCLFQYTCLGWILGRNTCGNELEVYDARDRLLGTIRQCPFYATRLIYMAEPRIGAAIGVASARIPWCRYCLQGIRRIWRDARVYKFDVVEPDGTTKIRIEQYIRDGNMFKFILFDELKNVGYVRKCIENQYTVTMWKHLDEKQKALLFAASFLFDHIQFQMSLEGTYKKIDEMRQGHGKMRPTASTCCPRSCQHNRCRFSLYLLLALSVFFVTTFLLVLSQSNY